MAFGIIEITIGTILFLLFIYYYNTRNFNYWKSKNIPGPKPVVFFGTIKDAVFGRKTFGEMLRQASEEFSNAPMVGLYVRNEPLLMINDMDLIKNVLIKDSKHFMDRSKPISETHEPLFGHLFFLEAKRWRPLRTKLTPVFTSGQLKEMFYLLNDCADKFEKYLDKYDGKNVDMRDVSAKFTTDVIGVCAFGLQANALEDEDSTFRQMGKRVFNFNWKNLVSQQLREITPALYELIGGWFADHELTNFFINLTKDTIEYRKKNNIYRHDFIDLLAALKNDNKKIDNIELTDSLLAAQLFVFFLAGFETSSSTISNCLFELALNPDIQTKLREEIKLKLKETDGKITYDLIKNMQYLDKVFKETLRKYPPAMFLMRVVTIPYTIPDTNITLPVKSGVVISNYAIQHNPQYFPNPKVFDPDRFTAEEIEKRPAMAYLPFGDGPRNCIGLRFGVMQTKVGIIKIIQNYTVDVCEETDKDYTVDNRNFLLAPKNGIVLRIKKQ